MQQYQGTLTEVATFVPAPSTTRGQTTKLSSSPDGTKIAYGSGRNAVLRPLFDSTAPAILFGHSQPVTVARISPTGYYCASGDAGGNIKVWDTTGSGSIKLEAKPIARITDIAFDGDGTRLVAVGEGRDKFGATFSLDTGASIGEIGGHSKTINAVAMKKSRPFRAVTASDDMTVCIANGVPFKFASQSRRHTRFVQTVDYAPSGALFVSGGSDGLLHLYDGATGDEKLSFVDPALSGQAHKGTIFQASFSRDNKFVATSSGDQMVKLWDVETGGIVQSWEFTKGTTPLASQQVGNTYLTSSIVSLSFSGALNVLDPREKNPTHEIVGHQQPITALAFDEGEKTFLSGDSAGVVKKFSESGVCGDVEGTGHSNYVVGIVGAKGEYWSAGWDDTVKGLTTSSYSNSTQSTSSIPKSLAISSSGTPFLATAKDIQSLPSGPTSSVSYSPTSIAVSADGESVAVGAEEGFVTIYGGKDLTEKGKVEVRGAVTAVAFSGDGKKLAAGRTDGKIYLYDFPSLTLIHARFTFQSARINALAFSPSDLHLASASLDESIRVYSIEKPGNVIHAKNVHRGGVSSLLWEDKETIVSGGADAAVKRLKLKV
ncbi:actin cortical patch component [Pseudohyphozyma bogoriensis]|nr:actin cortical patch component [Pseudohyphozyma bogoriensis]